MLPFLPSAATRTAFERGFVGGGGDAVESLFLKSGGIVMTIHLSHLSWPANAGHPGDT